MAHEAAAAEFERERPRLHALAYRMLGSVADAEDVVQETFVRWSAADRSEIRTPGAWLTTVCTRLALDALGAAHRRREEYVGPWLPEPIVEGWSSSPPDPAELSDSLSLAFLVLLERLTPLERAAFLLHDALGYGYDHVASALGRSEAASRQLVSRARRRLGPGSAGRFEASPARASALLSGFMEAARAGDVERLESMLTADVELWSDGGGEVSAARNILHGRYRVARFVAGIGRQTADVEVRGARVNGRPGVVLLRDGTPFAVLSTAATDEGIERVFIVLSPRKLSRARAPSAASRPAARPGSGPPTPSTARTS